MERVEVDPIARLLEQDIIGHNKRAMPGGRPYQVLWHAEVRCNEHKINCPYTNQEIHE